MWTAVSERDFTDSGIDVTEETKDMINGVSLSTNVGSKPLETVEDVRETLRNLKRKTDKAVVEFLKRSRNVLHEKIKKQNHDDRDNKLLDLISDLLLNREETDEIMTDMNDSSDKGNHLSVFEKSLCYILVDKALLNCLLVLDKAQMEGTFTDDDLESHENNTSSGQHLLIEFPQAIDGQREFAETREEREKEEVIEKMRCQIRELTSEKLRLKNENDSLVETNHWLEMKSDDLEMQNLVINEERQLLKEKVSLFEESTEGQQSCTEHLRQQIEILEQQKEEARNEKNLLKDQLQNIKEEQKQQLEYNKQEKNERETVKAAEGVSSELSTCSVSTQTPYNFTSEGSCTSKDSSESYLYKRPSEEDDMVAIIRSEKDDVMVGMTRENEELRLKLQSLQAFDKEKMIAHSEKNELLRVAKERSTILEQDLEEKSTENVLLRAHVLELKTTRTRAQETMQKMENDLRAIKEGKSSTDGDNTILRRQNKRLKEEALTLLHQTTMKKDDEQSDNIEGVCRNISSLRKHFVSLNKSVTEKERTIQILNEGATKADQRIQEMTGLLEELAKRNAVLVNKLEMMGAVTVVRNDFDVPDGYRVAVDGILRSQSSMLEKGIVAMMKATEENENERKLLKEQQRRLEYNIEDLETENILLKVQVNDLSQSVEELEEDVIHMKCGRHPGTPKSSGSGGHHVTFGDLGVEKREGEKLQSLIATAKRRCIHLERQIRTNTSLLKVTQDRNEKLERIRKELEKQNYCFRHCLSDFEQTNKILKNKVSELEDKLNEAGDGKSLDEMEKQSLEDRLNIMESQTKYLKDLVEALRKESTPSDEMQLAAIEQYQGLNTKEIDEVFSGKTDCKYEMECLKNKIKHQSTHSRILKCEIFEFLDDVRFLECELSCAVRASAVELTYKEVIDNSICTWRDTNISTWRDETSLCEQEGMAPIMAEILDFLKSMIQHLQHVSTNKETEDSDLVESGHHQHMLLRERLRNETAKLRVEKEQIQREVFAMKAIVGHLLEQTYSPAGSLSKACREEERSQKLGREILAYIERNCQMESDILDFVRQQSALEEELDDLKENILNLKVQKDVLLSFNNTNGSNNGNCVKCLNKSCEKVMRNFCFVKHEGHEAHGLFRVASEQENDDVFTCPSDEGVVCHSPDREAGSCDSGYHSTRHDEGHSMVVSDKVQDPGHVRHVPTGHPGSPGSLYENISRDAKLSEVSSRSSSEIKPKSILKKRPEKEEKKRSSNVQLQTEGRSGCKVCNFSDLFKPFKRTIQEHEDLYK